MQYKFNSLNKDHLQCALSQNLAKLGDVIAGTSRRLEAVSSAQKVDT